MILRLAIVVLIVAAVLLVVFTLVDVSCRGVSVAGLCDALGGAA